MHAAQTNKSTQPQVGTHLCVTYPLLRRKFADEIKKTNSLLNLGPSMLPDTRCPFLVAETSPCPAPPLCRRLAQTIPPGTHHFCEFFYLHISSRASIASSNKQPPSPTPRQVHTCTCGVGIRARSEPRAMMKRGMSINAHAIALTVPEALANGHSLPARLGSDLIMRLQHAPRKALEYHAPAWFRCHSLTSAAS